MKNETCNHQKKKVSFVKLLSTGCQANDVIIRSALMFSGLDASRNVLLPTTANNLGASPSENEEIPVNKHSRGKWA